MQDMLSYNVKQDITDNDINQPTGIFFPTTHAGWIDIGHGKAAIGFTIEDERVKFEVNEAIELTDKLVEECIKLIKDNRPIGIAR